MKNIFINVTDDELLEIFYDYLGSKELGIAVKSFKSYALQIKEKYFSNIPENQLSVCMDIVQRMFFEEIATRYFKLKIKE